MTCPCLDIREGEQDRGTFVWELEMQSRCKGSKNASLVYLESQYSNPDINLVPQTRLGAVVLSVLREAGQAFLDD